MQARRGAQARQRAASRKGAAVNNMIRTTGLWILMMCCGTASLCAQAARISAETGTADVFRNNQWMPIVPGDAINSGEKVRTGSDSSVTLATGSGQIIVLNSNSEIQLTDTGKRVYVADGRHILPVAVQQACPAFNISPYVFPGSPRVQDQAVK